jgi:hypothetical protein
VRRRGKAGVVVAGLGAEWEWCLCVGIYAALLSLVRGFVMYRLH